MYQGPSGTLPPVSVKEGETAEITQVFSSFPPPTTDTVMWHLDLPGELLVLHPGEQHHEGERNQNLSCE